MIEMQTKQTQPKPSNGAQSNYAPTQPHLQALNHRLIDLLGDDYAIELDDPHNFVHEGKPFIRFENRCVYYSHNDKHFDKNPSGWVGVSPTDGQIISGCWVCRRPQIIKHQGEYQPAPTLLTLSRNDPHLLKVLDAFGCKEVKEVNGSDQIAVAFPVTYADDDGSEGFHYRVALEGKNKWLHKEGGKAGEAVFALHRQGIQSGIQKKRFVIVTESPLDALVLIAAGFPSIAVLGKGNANALACDKHRETLLNLLSDDGVVYVWVEPDAPEFAQKVANALQRPVKVISPPVTEEEDQKALKDAYRLWLACGKDWVRFKAEIDRLIANATEVVAPQPETAIIPLGATQRKIVSLRQILDEADWQPLREITMPKNTRWQVEGLIKEGNLVILSARPKTSKSIVALNLAACIAMGKPFLDRSVTQGRALYVAYERYELTLQRALAMGLSDYDDFSLWDKVKRKLPAVDCLDGWIGFIERHGVKLVVFDTLVQFLRPALAKERNGINAYDFVYGILTEIQNAAGETGCTFVLIHHDRKGEKGEIDEAQILGSTALSASPDTILQLKPMGKKVICMKASGNEIEETTLYFTVGKNCWLELTDKPAMTKEEEAAQVIEDYLRQHGEATRQDLIRLLVEKGLAKASSAPVLLQRAFEDYLVYKIEKRLEGKHAVYRLTGESNRPSLPPSQPEPVMKVTVGVWGDQPDDNPTERPDLQDSPTEPVCDLRECPDPTEPADSPQQARPETGKENVTVVTRQPDQPDPTSNMCNTNNTSNNGYHVTGITGQPEPDPQPERRITTVTNSIGVMGLSNDRPEPDLQGNPTDPLWLVFDGVLPELVVDSPPEPKGDLPDDDSPTPPEGNPPDNEPDQPERQDSPTGDLKAKDLLVSHKAEVITEPICPACETELEPESNGKAACLGCGRVYFVVAPPQTHVSIQPAREHEGNPPDLPVNEPEIEFIRINSMSTRPEPEGNPPANEPVSEPEPDLLATINDESPPDRPDLQGNPPAKEPDPAVIKRVEGGCVVVATEDWVENEGVVVVASDEIPPEESGFAPPVLPANEPTPLLPVNEPEISPPDLPEPVAILTEPICPYCGEWLDPDQSGLATCAGCGRLFKVEPESDEDEFPPETPDDDDDNPPESPNGDGGSPPEAPNNGHNGSRQIGFAPPKDFAIPPAFQHADKLNSPAILNRITERLPDGSVKWVWQDKKKKKKTKTEIVTPADLAGWQPIETIPEISLPNIETVEIPPTVVLDIETTDKDPAKGRILAAGLALYVAGKEVETLIIDSDNGERELLVEVFDYLRETCDRLGEIVLTGYNLFDFDLTYLIERAAKRNVKRQCPFYYYTDGNGNVVRWRVATTEGTLKNEDLDYNAILVDRDLPIRIVDTLHLVCRWDNTAKRLIHYDLKSVAEHFEVNIPDRPVLSHKEIVHDYYRNRPRFNAYLLADLRETYAVFAKLIPPYVGIAALTELPLHLVVVKSTAWVWQQILKRYYNGSPQPDEKRDYEGGLVVSRRGLWSPCLKIDIASLYPTIMLAYRIHSRKDPAQYALRWLKTLTQQRLALKAKAKAGDQNAQILQEAMKILLNSLYGFYGTEGYGFNDMNAAEKITEIGRKVLTRMVAAIESKGGIIVEADTDGLIVCYRNADPQEILQEVNAAIPEVFKVETEWQEATVFVSDNKNYVVLDANGDLIAVKGSKWRGRDKPAFARKAIPTFLRLWVTQGKDAALNFAKQVLTEIRNGQGWHWVVQTHRVGEDDTNFIRAGFEVGERAIFAYKVRRKTVKDSEIAKSPDEGYDCIYYAAKFCETVKEVIEAIDPAQIEAWERMVASEARPLIFR